jgi:hypothetical protein
MENESTNTTNTHDITHPSHRSSSTPHNRSNPHPERIKSPSQVDKYTTIHNILQVGVAALETIDNPNPENAPKDVISLIKFISHKLTNNKHNQETKTIKNHLEHLNQKLTTSQKPSHPQSITTISLFLSTTNPYHIPHTPPPRNNQTLKTP